MNVRQRARVSLQLLQQNPKLLLYLLVCVGIIAAISLFPMIIFNVLEKKAAAYCIGTGFCNVSLILSLIKLFCSSLATLWVSVGIIYLCDKMWKREELAMGETISYATSRLGALCGVAIFEMVLGGLSTFIFSNLPRFFWCGLTTVSCFIIFNLVIAALVFVYILIRLSLLFLPFAAALEATNNIYSLLKIAVSAMKRAWKQAILGMLLLIVMPILVILTLILACLFSQVAILKALGIGLVIFGTIALLLACLASSIYLVGLYRNYQE